MTFKPGCAVRMNARKRRSTYPGLRHSSASQLINEKGPLVDQAQIVLVHKSRTTTLRYSAVESETRKALIEGKMISHDFTRKRERQLLENISNKSNT